jgi:hypothetical protein
VRPSRAASRAVYLIDSSSLTLTARSDWARFSDEVCAVKTHVIYDDAADCPIYAVVSTANVNDITAAKAMPIVNRATYVYDLGYYDYGWWAALVAAECRIVTRLKCNTKLTVTRTLPVAPAGPILSDCIGKLPARQAASRRNPLQVEVREVRVRIETGKVLRILTRSRRLRPGDRRSLQATLGHRAVFPLDQADPEDHPLPRHLRQRSPHPGGRRPDRFSAAAHGAETADRRPQSAGLCPAC